MIHLSRLNSLDNKDEAIQNMISDNITKSNKKVLNQNINIINTGNHQMNLESKNTNETCKLSIPRLIISEDLDKIHNKDTSKN